MTHLSSLRNVTALLPYLLAVLASPAAAQDSAFHLATTDPARAPSPAIGNGRIGVVIPALGIGAGPIGGRRSLVTLSGAKGTMPRMASFASLGWA
jgi:hypothetical protein